MANPALLLLADGRLPTGAHAHSAGVEVAVAGGHLRTVDDLLDFVESRIASSGLTEACIAAAACGGTFDLAEIDREMAARTPSPRLRSTSRSLGRQLLRVAEAAWPELPAAQLRALHRDGPMQPVALGAVARAAGVMPADAALCSLHHLVGTLTTAAIRLVGLDPFAVHAGCARLGTLLSTTAAHAAALVGRAPNLAHLPAHTSLLADAFAEQHATWEVRLFAS